jgi:threonylcarbamoyladenosine tRNA methylthiotransferase CDKAL1
MKFFLETYGCTANFGNSQELGKALEELGWQAAALAAADAVIVNTCAVTERTERKILCRLRQIQGSRLIIGGCLAAAMADSVEGIDCRKVMGILGRAAAQEIVRLFREAPAMHPQPSLDCRPDRCGIVNIAEGCTGVCSYCIVKKARGRLVSRRPEDVVEAVQRLVQSGTVEVQLTAQDTAAYGRDIGTSLPELLIAIGEIPGRYMVRIGMMNPNTAMCIMDDLVNALRSPRIYKFIHLPVQSGSDQVLERMCREYTAEEFIDICRRMRKEFPYMNIATDVIAGFPGEKKEDFEETLRVIEMIMPDKVNVTRYSRRPRTRAAQLYDMPDRIKKERSRRITMLWLEIADRRNHGYIGSALDVLVTERGKDCSMKARSFNYGGVVIKGLSSLGTWQRVRIASSNPFYLTGVSLPRDQDERTSSD